MVSSLRTFIALVSVTAVAAAAPDPAPAPTTAPTTTTTTTTAPASASPAAPAIATPAPDAPAKQVEKAQAVAETAKLTPIITNPYNPTRPAFQLYAEIDIPIVATGAVFALARLTRTQAAYCAPLCANMGLNAIDKLTAGYFSKGWSTASDFELYGIGAAAAVLLVHDEGALNALNDAVVVGQATLSATAVASIMTLAAGRPRPFLYSEKAPLSVRQSADAGLSFLSSHTAEAFAIVTSLYIAEKRLHPHALRPKVILGVGLGVATLVAVSRVMAGYHFITDVTGGAVVGSSIGVLIASVHNSPVQVVPVVNPETKSAGLGLTGTF
jgi:membrane-associated phospholipid phosphatase